jgi:hypothetical protein
MLMVLVVALEQVQEYVPPAVDPTAVKIPDDPEQIFIGGFTETVGVED